MKKEKEQYPPYGMPQSLIASIQMIGQNAGVGLILIGLAMARLARATANTMRLTAMVKEISLKINKTNKKEYVQGVKIEI